MSDNHSNDENAGRANPDGGGRKVRVAREFTFTHPDGRTQTFLPGEQELPDEVANHWFAQAHTEDAPEYEPPYGTLEHAYRMQGTRRRAEMEAAEYEEQRREELARAEAPEGSSAAARIRAANQATADRVTGMSGSPNPQRRTAAEQSAGETPVRRSPLPPDENKKS